jgi:hypothetical protein
MLRNRAVLGLVVMMVITACAPASVGGVQRSPLEKAKLAYADSSIAYEAGMEAIVAARSAHLVTDEQWAAVDKAQAVVRAVTPRWRAALTLWADSGTQPPSYSAVVAEVAEAVRTISKVAAEVKR